MRNSQVEPVADSNKFKCRACGVEFYNAIAISFYDIKHGWRLHIYSPSRSTCELINRQEIHHWRMLFQFCTRGYVKLKDWRLDLSSFFKLLSEVAEVLALRCCSRETGMHPSLFIPLDLIKFGQSGSMNQYTESVTDSVQYHQSIPSSIAEVQLEDLINWSSLQITSEGLTKVVYKLWTVKFSSIAHTFKQGQSDGGLSCPIHWHHCLLIEPSFSNLSVYQQSHCTYLQVCAQKQAVKNQICSIEHIHCIAIK